MELNGFKKRWEGVKLPDAILIEISLIYFPIILAVDQHMPEILRRKLRILKDEIH